MRTPTSAIVFGILNIVIGVLGFCGAIMGAVVLVLPMQPNDPMSRVLHGDSLAMAYVYVSSALNLVVSSWLIGSGIGLLLRQPWARSGSVIYGWIAIVYGAVTLTLNYLLLTRPMIAEMERMAASPPEQMGMRIGAVIGGVCGATFALGYPALLIYFMTRENVVRAFGGLPALPDDATLGPRNESGNPYQSPS